MRKKQQPRRIWSPQDGLDPRELSARGVEVWVPSFLGKGMLVSNLGAVWDLRGRVVKPHRNKQTGFLTVSIRHTSPVYVHLLVLASFSMEAGEGRRVRHLNGQKRDNRLCNLGWKPPRAAS